MTRQTRAGKQLTRQVQESKAQTKVDVVGEADGLGVFRTISFNKATSKWLEPLLVEIDDKRIESLETVDGLLHVTFVPTTKADDAAPFPLADAETVLSERGSE